MTAPTLEPTAMAPACPVEVALDDPRLDAWRAFLFAQAATFWAELDAGEASLETKGRLALANVNACRMAADVTRDLFDLVGAHAIFEGQPLERLIRDAQTVKQHMIVSLPAIESYGAMMLGTEHPSPLY